MKLGEIIDTGKAAFPKLQVVKHYDRYAVMILTASDGKAKGWFFGTMGSLKDCRAYARDFLKG